MFLNGGDPSRPIAYALDGYPIYGYDEPDGSPCRELDALNGHDDAKHGYHYHAGLLRVAVTPQAATVAFARSAIADGDQNRRAQANGAVVHEYTLAPRATR